MTDKADKRIYMDNAATSFPKPRVVHEAMMHFGTYLGASPGRGSYRESIEAGELLQTCRERINELINGENPDHVIFTLNCSDALNIGIKGVVEAGDHVITTELDHNSILRPFNALVKDGLVTQTRVKCDAVTGLVRVEDIADAIRPNTKLIALLHGSNVTGTLQDIERIGKIAKDAGVLFLVDGAQSLGHVPVDVQAMGIDLLAAPGHKGLLGPLGTGFLYIRPGLETQMKTLREGGTGSVSELDIQPEFMPDRFEPGSHNTIGLVGLSEGVKYLLDYGVEKVWAHDQQLMGVFLDTINGSGVEGLTIYGPPTVENRCGVFSIRVEGYACAVELSGVLENEYGILTRSGLHCAPGAHGTIGTGDVGGTTRLSFGIYTSEDDAKYAAESIVKIYNSIQTAKV